MSSNLAAIGYLIAAICFIVSLRGLSSPATSQRGLRAGILGMGRRSSSPSCRCPSRPSSPTS
jgi:NAD/NADP transhydrogenase beta subunit